MDNMRRKKLIPREDKDAIRPTQSPQQNIPYQVELEAAEPGMAIPSQEQDPESDGKELEIGDLDDADSNSEVLSVDRKQSAVAIWLKDTVELPQYSSLFEAQGFGNMEMMSELNHELLKELGVHKIADRLKVLKALKELDEKQGSNGVEEENEGMVLDTGGQI